ncbi:runt-related transcription factor 1 [Trichonephila clavipes]|nr:runt-related transcription factor 1 [Trichonephila clavipes]
MRNAEVFHAASYNKAPKPWGLITAAPKDLFLFRKDDDSKPLITFKKKLKARKKRKRKKEKKLSGEFLDGNLTFGYLDDQGRSFVISPSRPVNSNCRECPRALTFFSALIVCSLFCFWTERSPFADVQYLKRGQQYHLRAFASAFGHRPPFLDPRLVDPLTEWEHMRRKSEWAMDLPMRIPGPHGDPTQTGFTFGNEAQWNPHSAHYQNYLGHGLQPATGFAPCTQMDMASAHDSGHATPQTTPTGILPDRHSTSSSQTFPALSDQQNSPNPIKDPLFVTRYNNAMVAASELCLTDRLTELRHGLSGTNPTACNTYSTPNPFNNASLAFLAAGTSPHGTNLPYFAVSHGSYSLLSAGHGYYSNGNPSRTSNPSLMAAAAAASMYLTPPMVSPSLFYSQLYSSQNQLQSSMQFMNNGDTRSSSAEEDTIATQRCLDSGGPSISRDSSTSDSILQSECSSNHSSADVRRSSVSDDTRRLDSSVRDQQQQHIVMTNHSSSNSNTDLFPTEPSRQSQSDSNLWRPY